MKKVNLYSWNNLVLLCNNRRSWGIVNSAACKNKNIHFREKIMLNHQIFIFTFFFFVYFLYFFWSQYFLRFIHSRSYILLLIIPFQNLIYPSYFYCNVKIRFKFDISDFEMALLCEGQKFNWTEKLTRKLI